MAYSAERYIAGLGKNFYLKPEHIDVRGGIEQLVPGLSNDLVEFDYNKHVNVLGGAEKYLPHIGKLKFVHPMDVINKPAPTLVPDTTGNTAISVIDITFTDDAFYRTQITKITKGGVEIPTSKYTVSAGKISFIASTFSVGSNAVVIEATGYNNATATQVTT